MYILPKSIAQGKLTELLTYRKDGVADPTPYIKHSDLPRFLNNCESNGLTPQAHKLLKISKDLREFVNYQPRIEWQDQKLLFRTKKFKLQDLEQVVDSIESIIEASLSWAGQQGEASQLTSKIAKLALKQFLEQNDLLYKEWCSPQVLSEADRIRRKFLRS